MPTGMKRERASRPTWTSISGTSVDWGPGSRVTDDINKYHSWADMAETVTIDETLASLGFDRVDFIKMDIDGAELDALKGAEASIRKHRPKLAISLYHKPDDFDSIPRYLAGLDLGYRFYLEQLGESAKLQGCLRCYRKPSPNPSTKGAG
jgi:hypothetical protein